MRKIRIHVEFQTEKQELPIDYRRVFVSILKSALTQYCEGVLYPKYYKDTNQKDYTWSIQLTKPVFKSDKIILGDNCVKMLISTDETGKTGFYLFAAIMKLKNKRLPLANGNFMVLENIKQVEQQVITGKNCLFKTAPGSAIIVREHVRETNKDRYYSVADVEFEEKLIESLKRQVQIAGFMEEDYAMIQCQVVDCKKVVIKNYGIYMDATVGVIDIQATPMLLQHFYQNGISGKRSMGFGMLELLAQQG